MTRFERVRQLLNDAVGTRSPSHGGRGKFWNLPLDQLKTLKVVGQRVIETEGADRGARSGLVKALKGDPPFDEDGFDRMPLGGLYLADTDIAFIQKWIDDGCPEDEFTPPAS
jgi:hypothetical protein